MHQARTIECAHPHEQLDASFSLFFSRRVVVQHDYPIYADVRTYDDVMWCRVGATIISRRISADTTEYVVAKEADETTALINGPDDDMSDYILPAPEFK